MTTKHTCGGPVFGRRTPGCPRCDELIAGAEPVKWSQRLQKEQDQRYMDEIRNHDCKKSGCGPVCTFGEW